MEHRLAIIGIIIEDLNSVEAVNQLLHENGSFILGRMGLPYRERGVNVISVILDAPNDTINTLAGNLGKLKGVTAKAVYSKLA